MAHSHSSCPEEFCTCTSLSFHPSRQHYCSAAACPSLQHPSECKALCAIHIKSYFSQNIFNQVLNSSMRIPIKFLLLKPSFVSFFHESARFILTRLFWGLVRQMFELLWLSIVLVLLALWLVSKGNIGIFLIEFQTYLTEFVTQSFCRNSNVMAHELQNVTDRSLFSLWYIAGH